jgi:hypothetical protein
MILEWLSRPRSTCVEEAAVLAVGAPVKVMHQVRMYILFLIYYLNPLYAWDSWLVHYQPLTHNLVEPFNKLF